MKMATYRVCLLGPSGRAIGIQRFSAESQRIAVAIARGMSKEDISFVGFELWTAKRRVLTETVGESTFDPPVSRGSG